MENTNVFDDLRRLHEANVDRWKKIENILENLKNKQLSDNERDIVELINLMIQHFKPLCAQEGFSKDINSLFDFFKGK